MIGKTKNTIVKIAAFLLAFLVFSATGFAYRPYYNYGSNYYSYYGLYAKPYYYTNYGTTVVASYENEPVMPYYASISYVKGNNAYSISISQGVNYDKFYGFFFTAKPNPYLMYGNTLAYYPVAYNPLFCIGFLCFY